MNRKEFKGLMSTMTSLLEGVNQEERVLAESKGASLQERINALKTVRPLREGEADYSPLKGVEGVAASGVSGGPKGDSKDSSKPRVVPTATMSNMNKKLAGGLVSKPGSSNMDALDMGKRSGKLAPEEPEAEGADYEPEPEPEEYGESIAKLQADWKRLMGEADWTKHGSGSLGVSSLPKTNKPAMGDKKPLPGKGAMAPVAKSSPPPVVSGKHIASPLQKAANKSIISRMMAKHMPASEKDSNSKVLSRMNAKNTRHPAEDQFYGPDED